MKKILLSGLLYLFFINPVAAQAAPDSSEYLAGVHMISKAKTVDQYLAAAFYFNMLMRTHTVDWLSYYYEAFSYIQASQQSLVSEQKDELLDRAQPIITKALELEPGASELLTLQAFLYQARLQVDPASRALNFSKKAEEALKQAITADPSNPRAHFLMACNVYYTPPVFKGGPKNALPLFLKAKEKFATFIPAHSFMPQWGTTENQQMIAECNRKLQ
jgi:tetratricopeptide (TPR) repeat protein